VSNVHPKTNRPIVDHVERTSLNKEFRPVLSPTLTLPKSAIKDSEPAKSRKSQRFPQGWIEARIGEVLRLYNGAPFKPSDWSTRGLPIIRIQNLNNPEKPFNYYSGNLNPRFRVRSGDLLFAWSGTPGTSFGAHVWKGGDAWLNQHIFRVEFSAELFDSEFLRLAINRNLQAYIAKAHGGAGLAHITKGTFESFNILLPPLAEQRRIVARLEALETRIRRARSLLADIPNQLAQIRQSILLSAFRGDLTADWRKHHNSPNWPTKQIEDICTESFYGPRFSDNDYNPSGIPTIRTTDFTANGSIELRNTPRVMVPAARREKFLLRAGDLLVTRTGSIGKMAIFRGGYDALASAYLIRFRFNDEVTPDFVFQCLCSPAWQNLMGLSTTAVTQPNINAEAIRRLPIPIPSISEQKEIVRRLEAAHSRLDAMLEAHLAATIELDRLSQSIISRAFSGTLVAQDPVDEPSEKTLARVLQGSAQKPRAPISRMSRKPNSKSVREVLSLVEVLRTGGEMPPEDLFRAAGRNSAELDDVEDFYVELRQLIRKGLVVERRPDNASVLLSAKT